MEQALVIMSFTLSTRRLLVDDATVTLPSHLDDLAILDQDGHGALSTRDFAHASARCGIGLHVVLHKLTALPLQPLAYFAGVWTASSSIEFKLGHASVPPTIRG
jgi:hypothetical protein